ncbi:unnamed protein product, partial [Urochloa humidicola]
MRHPFYEKLPVKDDASSANGKPAAKKWSPGSYSNRPRTWSYLSTNVRSAICN